MALVPGRLNTERFSHKTPKQPLSKVPFSVYVRGKHLVQLPIKGEVRGGERKRRNTEAFCRHNYPPSVSVVLEVVEIVRT